MLSSSNVSIFHIWVRDISRWALLISTQWIFHSKVTDIRTLLTIMKELRLEPSATHTVQLWTLTYIHSILTQPNRWQTMWITAIYLNGALNKRLDSNRFFKFGTSGCVKFLIHSNTLSPSPCSHQFCCGFFLHVACNIQEHTRENHRLVCLRVCVSIYYVGDQNFKI